MASTKTTDAGRKAEIAGNAAPTGRGENEMASTDAGIRTFVEDAGAANDSLAAAIMYMEPIGMRGAK